MNQSIDIEQDLNQAVLDGSLSGEVEKALAYSLRLLGYRARSEFELKDRLARKDFSEPAIQQVVDRLREIDLIDDREFAQSWVQSRLAARPLGPIRLRWELKKKGIEESIAAAVISQVFPGETEQSMARELAERELAKQEQVRPADLARIKRLLIRRGFSFDIVQQVVTRLWDRKSAP